MYEQQATSIARVLEGLRRKLLETGTRNRLIHVNRANQRANCLNIINEKSDEVFSRLRTQTQRMRFKAMGKDRGATEQEMTLALALPDETLPVGSDRHTDPFLETPLGPEALARRLLRLARDARTAEEEQGLNILFLALGFLRWKEASGSDVFREAPLVLLPVELVRNERTSTFDIRAREDDIRTNLPLQERLRQDFNIALPEIDEEEGWTPSAYMTRVVESVSGHAGWSVETDGMQLGFFSFAKLLMHHDLNLAAWPEDVLDTNDLLAGLLAKGFEPDQPHFTLEDKLDALLDPAEIIQVIDADASQTKVIEEVRRGASLVVQGPPGTGKSQTITNIIAAAAYDGQSVLFIAEKMAALSVVHQRLVKTGLGDICLELHSRSANKRAVVQELGRTLSASAKPLPTANGVERLRATRDELNRIADLLHQPLPPTGESPFRAMAEIIGFIGQGTIPPSISLAGLEVLAREERTRASAAIHRYVAALQAAGPPEDHPFRGTTVYDLQPFDLARLDLELDKAVGAMANLLDEVARLGSILRQVPPDTLNDMATLSQALALLAKAPEGAAQRVPLLYAKVDEARMIEGLTVGQEWWQAREAAEGTFTTAAWTADVVSIRAGIAKGQASFLSRLFGPYPRVTAELASLLAGPMPKAPRDRLALVDQLAEVQARRRRLAEDEDWLQNALDEHWRGERTPFATFLATAQWLRDIKRGGSLSSAQDVITALAALPDPAGVAAALQAQVNEARLAAETPLGRLGLNLPEAGLGPDLQRSSLSRLITVFTGMREAKLGYVEWTDLARARAATVEAGAKAIVDAIVTGRLDPTQAVSEFAYACAAARWTAARRARPGLDRLVEFDRHELVKVFRDLEQERLQIAQTLILAKHYEQMPLGAMGEMGVIRGEIARKRGHKPIRWLMENAGSMVQRIKPVLLMSPISVAQFLPPGRLTFDLVVIDEASQVRPEDALGVIARAKRIVVVGDQKQLPPTSFFDRLVDEEESNDDEDEEMPLAAMAADMESVLSLCEARGLRSRMLEWHYRSRDPSLIRVSNAEFYGDRLVLPPSPLQMDDHYGLKFHRIPGVYARGGSGLGRQGTNRIEAQAVVKAMADHARHWPDLSLGVVSFSKAQADMLTEVLELERRGDPILDGFLREGRQEDVFVKNIENVQGDERDVILISVGYGPQEPNGRLTAMTFGPINAEGGERRLNVLFSRARVRCEVFASFDPGDIDLNRTQRVGPRVLKRFLEFAKTGIIEEHVPTGLVADSPFEEDVATVIRGLGYEADPQVGSSGFRIDIGVRHPDRPGQYLVAVECDGAAYHAALWARERDRLRQDILENLGWRFHRIWSTDWFHRREPEIRRLKQALDAARIAAQHGITVRGANAGGFLAPVEPEVVEQPPIDFGHLQLSAPPYQKAEISLHSTVEPHLAPLSQRIDLIVRVVAIEGPLHLEELARRVAAAYGKKSTGRRIKDATVEAVTAAIHQGKGIEQEGSFLMTASQKAEPPVRDRNAIPAGNSLLKAVYLPPMEIRAAASRIQQESGDMAPEEMVRAVARLLGFLRVGPDLSSVIAQALNPE